MKKTLLTLFFFSFLYNLSAQQVMVEPNPSIFEEEGLDLENQFLEVYNFAIMKNEGTEETEYAWIRVIESAPEEWDFPIADINQEFFPVIDKAPAPVILAAGEEGILRVGMRPKGVAGCGTVRMDIALWNDTGEHEVIYSAYYEFKVNTPGECLSSINENEVEDLYLSPNPTNDFFTIKTDAPFTKIRIIDTSGKLVKVFSRNDLYDIFELEEALYFVEIFNDNEKIAVEKIIRH